MIGFAYENDKARSSNGVNQRSLGFVTRCTRRQMAVGSTDVFLHMSYCDEFVDKLLKIDFM